MKRKEAKKVSAKLEKQDMKSKKTARLRRARRGRAKMRELLVPRLSVYRSPRHIYAQVISEDGSSVKAATSTLEDLRAGSTGNVEGAAKVGALIWRQRQLDCPGRLIVRATSTTGGSRHSLMLPERVDSNFKEGRPTSRRLGEGGDGKPFDPKLREALERRVSKRNRKKSVCKGR